MKTDDVTFKYVLLGIGASIWLGILTLACPRTGDAAEIVRVDFPPGEVDFPDNTNITNEFSNRGIVFSADDSDLPSEFQQSQGLQENLIRDQTFFNLFRVNFISSEPVISVSVILGDNNANPQTHTLTAFDKDGNVLDSSSFEDGLGGTFQGTFNLTVSSNNDIASIVAIEQPFGAERLERLTYITEDRFGHQTCYTIKPIHGRFKRRTIILKDQFGEQEFKVRRPTHLCVPSSKELVE